MNASLRLTLLAVLLGVFMVIAIVGLGVFLRKLTKEIHKNDTDKKQCWRYIVPLLTAMVLASLQFHGGVIYHYLYFILGAIAIPVLMSYYFLRQGLENKKERIIMLVALLCFFYTTSYGMIYYNHFRNAHADSIDSGEFENNHIYVRNWYFIPMMVLTILVGVIAGHVWRKEGRKENDGLLPYHNADLV